MSTGEKGIHKNQSEDLDWNQQLISQKHGLFPLYLELKLRVQQRVKKIREKKWIINVIARKSFLN